MGAVFKLEAVPEQVRPGGFCGFLIFRKEGLQNIPVLSQGIVDVAYEVVVARLQPVVVVVSAIVVAELFVRPAKDGLFTVQTGSFFL